VGFRAGRPDSILLEAAGQIFLPVRGRRPARPRAFLRFGAESAVDFLADADFDLVRFAALFFDRAPVPNIIRPTSSNARTDAVMGCANIGFSASAALMFSSASAQVLEAFLSLRSGIHISG
jgi:hypothetical protein